MAREGTNTAKSSTRAAPIDGSSAAPDRKLWTITLRGPGGRTYPPRHVVESVNRLDTFRAHLLSIARMELAADSRGAPDWIGDFELEVRDASQEHNGPPRSDSALARGRQ
jgi:hypothetical protein